MADLIEDPKKKKASFGDAAAAAADPGVMQIGGATRPAPMAAPAAPDIGPFVGKPGDFPVNPDGTPMVKTAAAPQLGAAPVKQQARGGSFPGVSATMSGMVDDVQSAVRAGNYGAAAGEVFRGTSALPIAAIDDVVMNPARKIGGFISNDLAKPGIDAVKEFGRAALGMQPGQKLTLAGDATMPGNDMARFVVPAQSESPLPAAPNQTAVLPSSVPSVHAVPAGAVKTQGQMNMEADLKSAEAMKAERLAAEGRAPQAVVTHSGNDWQARNNLRNLEVSASSLTAQPQDVQAYIDARKHDTSLQGGGTAADIANVAAANRNNEINSTAQVANARTAQQGQQFGASHELATQRLALDSRKADIADAGSKIDNATKKQLQDLSAQIMKETDPAKLAVLQDKYQTITGRYQRPDPAARELYKAVTDPVTGKVTMYNTQTGEIGTGQQTPYPEGTRLTGPDKKAYIVKNGVPVPA